MSVVKNAGTVETQAKKPGASLSALRLKLLTDRLVPKYVETKVYDAGLYYGIDGAIKHLDKSQLESAWSSQYAKEKAAFAKFFSDVEELTSKELFSFAPPSQFVPALGEYNSQNGTSIKFSQDCLGQIACIKNARLELMSKGKEKYFFQNSGSRVTVSKPDIFVFYDERKVAAFHFREGKLLKFLGRQGLAKPVTKKTLSGIKIGESLPPLNGKDAYRYIVTKIETRWQCTRFLCQFFMEKSGAAGKDHFQDLENLTKAMDMKLNKFRDLYSLMSDHLEILCGKRMGGARDPHNNISILEDLIHLLKKLGSEWAKRY